MARTDKQRQFITDYRKAAPFLEKVFYYGSYSAQELAEVCNFGKNEYYRKRKILMYVFGDLVEETTNVRGQKALGLRIDHLRDPHRAFLRFFALKSFTSVERLLRICYIIQRINSEGSCTFKKLSQELEGIIQDITAAKGGEELDDIKESPGISSTVFRILKEMHSRGLLVKKGSGYSIAYDAARLKSSDIRLLVDFCTSAYPLSVCGSGVLNKIDQKYESPFLFKHCHLGQIFSDETIWQLMVCIHNRQTVNITIQKGIVLYDLLPYRIINNKETGRQYVFAVYTGEEDYAEYLLLRIDSIKKLDVTFVSGMSDEELVEKYETAFRYSFNGTAIIQRNEEPSEGTLIYDSSFEWNIRKHFPDCQSVHVDNNRKEVRVRVNSFTELKPWLRVNADKVRLMESSDGVAEKFREESAKWREMYDI